MACCCARILCERRGCDIATGEVGGCTLFGLELELTVGVVVEGGVLAGVKFGGVGCILSRFGLELAIGVVVWGRVGVGVKSLKAQSYWSFHILGCTCNH